MTQKPIVGLQISTRTYSCEKYWEVEASFWEAQGHIPPRSIFSGFLIESSQNYSVI